MASVSSLFLDCGAVADDLCENVRLPQNQNVVRPELDLGPAVLGEDDLVTLLDVHLDVLPVLVARAGTDGEDAAALRLLLRRIGQHDAAGRDLLFLEDLDDQAVTKRLQIHVVASSLLDFVTLAGTRTVRVPAAFYKSWSAMQTRTTSALSESVTSCRDA